MSKPSRDELIAAIQVLFAKRRDPLTAWQLKVFGRRRDDEVVAEDMRYEASEIVADAILGVYEAEDDGR